jgi:hypothetical protein
MESHPIHPTQQVLGSALRQARPSYLAELSAKQQTSVTLSQTRGSAFTSVAGKSGLRRPQTRLASRINVAAANDWLPIRRSRRFKMIKKAIGVCSFRKCRLREIQYN